LNFKWVVFKVEEKKGKEVHLRQAVYGDEESAKNEAKGMEGKEAKFDSMARMRNPDTLLAKNGGDLGTVALSGLPKEVQLALSKVVAGKMTAPVKTYPEYALFKLEERKQESVRSYADVQESIRGRLLRPKQQERYDAFIANLKKTAKIEKYLKPVEEKKEK
jgi:parvulin-like peptidyl-prolyl isomerase